MWTAAMVYDNTVDMRLRLRQTGWMYKDRQSIMCFNIIADSQIVVKRTYRVSANPVLSVNQCETTVIVKLM